MLNSFLEALKKELECFFNDAIEIIQTKEDK